MTRVQDEHQHDAVGEVGAADRERRPQEEPRLRQAGEVWSFEYDG